MTFSLGLRAALNLPGGGAEFLQAQQKLELVPSGAHTTEALRESPLCGDLGHTYLCAHICEQERSVTEQFLRVMLSDVFKSIFNLYKMVVTAYQLDVTVHYGSQSLKDTVLMYSIVLALVVLSK